MATPSGSFWTRQLLLLLFVFASLRSAHAYTSRRYVNPWDARALARPKPRDVLRTPRAGAPARRQADAGAVPPSMDINCVWKCSVATCGSSCSLPATAARRRGEEQALLGLLGLGLVGPDEPAWNGSAPAPAPNALGARQAGGFTTNPDKWTRKALDAYLPKCLNTPEDLFDGNVQYLTVDMANTDNMMATVAASRTFSGRTALQIGTGGLHGCTVVTLVSQRAVWMAHFWQGYAMDGAGSEISDDPSDADFQTRVLNFMAGSGTQDPTNVGGSVDWSLFNKEGDNTWLFIHTPAVASWRGDSKDGQKAEFTLYQNKAAAIAELVRGKVAGVRSEVHIYKPLDYEYKVYSDGEEEVSGPDRSRVNKSARGMVFFQFDGGGSRAQWRLFTEYAVYNAQGLVNG